MRIEGEEAAGYAVVLLDSFRSPYGKDCKLVVADDQTGVVEWADQTGAVKSIVFGQNAIRIIPRHTRS